MPGSGKTTVAAQLEADFQRQCPEASLQVLSMDGFHLSKAQLSQFPNPERAFARRGAPWTFDAAGFVQKVRALKAGQAAVTWPSFDHSVGDPVADALVVEFSCQFVVIEGLYVLYREGAWAGLADLFDETWYLDTLPDVAQARLIQRHQQAWGVSYEQALQRVLSSDAKNAALVASLRDQADYRLVAD
jgi:pantothenate kinase